MNTNALVDSYASEKLIDDGTLAVYCSGRGVLQYVERKRLPVAIWQTIVRSDSLLFIVGLDKEGN